MIVIAAIIVLLFVVVSYIYFGKKGKGEAYDRLPPLAPSDIWKIVVGSGIDRLSHFQELSEWCQNRFQHKCENGATFIITTPYFGFGSNTIVCCDYKLARLILSGSANGNIKESEKTTLTQNLNMFDNVCSLLT